MALLKIYAVRDTKAESFMQPFFSQADGLAARSFADVVNDPQHMFNRHPGDFELFCLGVFQDADGTIAGADKPRFIVSAATLKKDASNG